MRNHLELSEEEVRELALLYPTTPNRKLCLRFDISYEVLRKYFAKPYGWKKDEAAVRLATRGTYHRLTEDEELWVREHFADMRNIDIMDYLGIGEHALSSVSKKYGLTKSAAFIESSHRKAAEHTLRTMKKFGGRADAAARARAQWEERKAIGDYGNVGFKKGVSNMERLGEEQYKATIEKIRTTRNEIIRRDRVRIHWGMEPKTKLVKNWDANPDWHKKHYRYTMRKRGYIIEDNTAYYDSETRRSVLIEKHAMKYGIKTKELEEDD